MAANGLGSVNIRKFGGLQLSSDPADVGLERALSGENFELARDGSFIRSRDGVTRLGAAAALSGSVCYRLIPDNDPATPKLLALSTDSNVTAFLDSVTTGGVVTAVGNWTVGGFAAFFDAVNFGTPTAQTTFIASDGALMRKYTGGVLSASVGKPKYLAVTPLSNRLVQARFDAAADSPTGALGSLSTVFFSDLGAPETYTATSYIHLRPGDGESIRGVASYRGQTFIFKETAVWIFYGEGMLPSGQPEFLYRVVNLGSRVANIAGPVVAVTSQGVYYLAVDGVYLTTGGAPTKVSGSLDELFRLATLGGSTDALWAAGDRVIVATSHGAVAYVYVLDERRGDWLRWSSDVWSYPLQPFVSWQKSLLGSPESLFFAQFDSLLYTDDAATSDAGSAIVSSYQSGFSDLGAASVKTVVRSQVWGSGTVTHSMAVDYNAADSGSALTLGTAPAVDDAQDRIARRGTQFSFKVAASSGAWRVNSVGLHVRSPRPVGSTP